MDTKALVTLCQKGNGQALSLLYENYSEKMLKVCLRYIPDPTIAQDLLHDGFVIIFTSIHSLRNPEKLEYWMKKIMRNLALQYLNHANANPTILLIFRKRKSLLKILFVRISFRTIRCWI